MKLVPYTVMVPEHYAVFLQEMEVALSDFGYVSTTSLAENTINHRDTYEAVEQTFGWNFDTEAERLAACDAIEAACDRLRKAEDELHTTKVAA